MTSMALAPLSAQPDDDDDRRQEEAIDDEDVRATGVRR